MGKGKKSKGPPVDFETLKEQLLADTTKQGYQDRILDLLKQNRVLVDRNQKLKEELSLTNADQADVYVYLHQKIDENFEVIDNLEHKNADLEEALEKLKKLKADELAQQRQDYEIEIANLNEKVAELERQLATLQDFRDNRQKVQETMTNLQEELEREKRERAEEVAALERKNARDREDMKNKLLHRIQDVKRSILEENKNMLSDTTKRTMAENEQMTTELTYQSKQSEQLMEQNNLLRKENARLRRENELQQQTVEELIVRRQKQKSLVTKLHERVTELEAASVEADRKRDTKVSTQEKHMLALQKQLEEAKQAEGSVRSELKQATRRIAAVLKEKERMMALQDDTVRFLMQAVNDLQAQFASFDTPSLPALSNGHGRKGSAAGLGGEDAPSARIVSLDRLDPGQRERAIQLLLAKMQLYQATVAAYGTGKSDSTDDPATATKDLSVLLPSIQSSKSQPALRSPLSGSSRKQKRASGKERFRASAV